MWWIFGVIGICLVWYGLIHTTVFFIESKKFNKKMLTKETFKNINNKLFPKVKTNLALDKVPENLFSLPVTDKTIILDIQTSSLDENAEILEVTVIDLTGQVLLNSLVKPKMTITPEATAIHGITNEMVYDAPRWEDIYTKFREIIKAADLVIAYNEKQIKKLIMQSCRLAKLSVPQFMSDCVMQSIAQFNIEQKRRKKTEPKSLELLASERGIKIKKLTHRTLDNCNIIKQLIASF